MTPLFFQDEVFLDCSKDLDSSECTFSFKGKEIYLKHTLEDKPKQRVHRMTCSVDGQTFHFGIDSSSQGNETFGTWPNIHFKGKLYRLKLVWSLTNGEKGIQLEMEDNPELIAAHREALAEIMKKERTHSSIMDYMTSHRLSRGEKQRENIHSDKQKTISVQYFSPSHTQSWNEEINRSAIDKELPQSMEETESDDLDEPSGRKKLQQIITEIRNEFKDLKQPIKNQEELDDVEGFLHIHTLPPEARKKIIEQLKNKKK
jgi:hypothetical protein